MNTKDPSVQLFSIPIYCLCMQYVECTKSSFKGLQTIITTIGIILHSQRNYHFISFKCPKNCKMFSSKSCCSTNKSNLFIMGPPSRVTILIKVSFHFFHLISIGHAPCFHIISYMEIFFLISHYHYTIQK